MIKAVVFDMDGVLVDTEWFFNRRRVAYLEQNGFHFDEIPDLTGSDERSIWEFFVPGDEVRREELRVGYLAYQKDHPVPYAELVNESARPVLRDLRARGIRTAIASSSPREHIEDLIEHAALHGLLDYIISGHDCTAFKPDPEIYLRTMEALGVTPTETVIIEDSPIVIRAGKASGGLVLALRPREGVQLDQGEADAVIESLDEVIGCIG